MYTLRLGIQPMDGDHMGTAPYNEFCLLCPADQDKKPDLLEAEGTARAEHQVDGRKHPGMMLLFPNTKPADAPAVEAKPKDHWVLSFRVPVDGRRAEGGARVQPGRGRRHRWRSSRCASCSPS